MLQTELWLTPLILLPGVALLVASTSARLAQMHGEFHHLLDHHDGHAKILSRQLVSRARRLRNALVSLYSSVCIFSFSALLGGILNVWQPQWVWTAGGVTLLGIIALFYAAFELAWESVTCMRIIDEHRARVAERNAPSGDPAPGPAD